MYRLGGKNEFLGIVYLVISSVCPQIHSHDSAHLKVKLP